MFSAFDKMTADLKKLILHEKTEEFSATITVPADPLKIEIPTNRTGATHNKDNRVNKLVTVFALCPCTWIDLACFTPRPRTDSQFNFVNRESFLAREIIVPRNSYTYQHCTWMAKTAPCFASYGCVSTSC